MWNLIEVVEMNNKTMDFIKEKIETIGKKFRKKPVIIRAFKTDKELIIPTLEGNHKANVGDWIIEGVNGEFYPCKSDIFEKTYEEVK